MSLSKELFHSKLPLRRSTQVHDFRRFTQVFQDLGPFTVLHEYYLSKSHESMPNRPSETVDKYGSEIRIFCKILLHTYPGQILLRLIMCWEVLVGVIGCTKSLKACRLAYDVHENLFRRHCTLYAYFDIKNRILHDSPYFWCSLHIYAEALVVVGVLILLIRMYRKHQQVDRSEFFFMTPLMILLWIWMFVLAFYIRRGVDSTCEKNLQEGTIPVCSGESYYQVDWWTFTPKYMQGFGYPVKLRYSEKMSWEALAYWSVVVVVYVIRNNPIVNDWWRIFKSKAMKFLTCKTRNKYRDVGVLLDI